MKKNQSLINFFYSYIYSQCFILKEIFFNPVAAEEIFFYSNEE